MSKTQEKKKLILIGNGMAGMQVLQQLLQRTTQYSIKVFGSEPYPNYDRTKLLHILTGDQKLEDIVLHDWDWYREHQIQLYTGTKVTHIYPREKVVYAEGGIISEYDRLVIATGSKPAMIDVPGTGKEGVIAFRNLLNCDYMKCAAQTKKKATVIGGGRRGLEAAKGLRMLGMEVDVVHLQDRLMENRLNETESQLLLEEMQALGIRFHFNKQTTKILGEASVSGVLFDDGTSLSTDLLVVTTGKHPNAELALDSGIRVNRGILVDDRMRTSVQGVYAVGECAEFNGQIFDSIEAIYEQCEVLAEYLTRIINNADLENQLAPVY